MSELYRLEVGKCYQDGDMTFYVVSEATHMSLYPPSSTKQDGLIYSYFIITPDDSNTGLDKGQHIWSDKFTPQYIQNELRMLDLVEERVFKSKMNRFNRSWR